jgi:hypothetical protein
LFHAWNGAYASLDLGNAAGAFRALDRYFQNIGGGRFAPLASSRTAEKLFMRQMLV